MKNFKTTLLFLFLTLSITSGAQSLNSNWSADLTEALRQFTTCSGGSECAQYAAKSLQTVYKLGDFFLAQSDRYMHVSEIAAFLNDSKQWKMLGHAYEQDVLKEAQQYANGKKAVVALYVSSDGAGHLALILPGELHPSGSWGLSVPNSASFLSVDPAKSYVGKGLSYAFAKHHLKDVVIFARDY